MKKIVIPILCALCCCSCTPLARVLYGVKQPAVESPKTIVAFNKSMGFTNAPVYALKPDAWSLKPSVEILDVYVFDKEGRFIPYKDPSKPNCSGPAELFLSYLDKQTTYLTGDEWTLNSFYALLQSLDCKAVAPTHQSDVDFYVFFTTAKFAGRKLQQKKTVVWMDSLQQNHSVKVETILVNMDFQKCWSKEQLEAVGK